MEKIFEVTYDPDSKKPRVIPINPPENINNMREHIYEVAERDGSKEAYVIYISKRELDILLDKDDGR